MLHGITFRNIFIIGIVLMQTVFTIGCSGDNDITAGACYHEFLTPVVEVYSVTDSVTGDPIDSFTISEIKVDDNVESFSHFTYDPSYGVEEVDGLLICEVPCGFGTMEGDYVVVVSAEGYSAKTIQFEAFYEELRLGCPSFNEGSTTIDIILDPL